MNIILLTIFEFKFKQCVKFTHFIFKCKFELKNCQHFLSTVFKYKFQMTNIYIYIYIYTHIQWGKKVFSQPPIVQVLPLKKMREACNFHHRYTSTMRDKIKKEIQKITL